MKKLLISLFLIMVLTARTNAEYIDEYLGGEKVLYPLSYIDNAFATNKYVHITPVSQVIFVFQSPDKDYVMVNLAAERVHFVFDSIKDYPTVRFRWVATSRVRSGDFAAMSAQIIYAKVSLKKKELQLEKSE